MRGLNQYSHSKSHLPHFGGTNRSEAAKPILAEKSSKILKVPQQLGTFQGMHLESSRMAGKSLKTSWTQVSNARDGFEQCPGDGLGFGGSPSPLLAQETNTESWNLV